MKATQRNAITHDMEAGTTRRGVLRLLGRVSAITAAGLIGAQGLSQPAAARRRRKKQRTSNTSSPEPSQAAQTQVLDSGDEVTADTSISSYCRYVWCRDMFGRVWRCRRCY